MKLHTMFEGGPANGILASVTIGVFEKEEPPAELRLSSSDSPGFAKTKAHIYRLVGFEKMTGAGRTYQATYRYSHDYNDLPVTLVDYLF